MKNALGLIAALALTLAMTTASFADTVKNDTGKVREGMIRYQGFVIDEETGESLVGVCIWAGPTGCPDPALHSDARGYWSIDMPKGFNLTWDMHFGIEGYQTQDALMGTDRHLILIGLHR